MNDEDILKPIQVAKLVGVHRVTIRNWVNSGRLPVAFRAGSTVRFRWGDVKKALGAGAQVPVITENPGKEPNEDSPSTYITYLTGRTPGPVDGIVPGNDAEDSKCGRLIG